METGSWPHFDRIFATSVETPPHTLREMQTVQPLAASIGLDIDLSFAKEDTALLGEAVSGLARRSCGSAILISWEHCR